MALLELETGARLTSLAEIQSQLAALRVGLEVWPVDARSSGELLAQPSLNDEEKERVLTALDHRFEQLKTLAGYHSRDLIVLHPLTPGLDDVLSKFNRVHFHADDEVRYIVDGEGVFGFVRPDEAQVQLTVEAGEYIRVPARTRHWFRLTARRRIKAVRYFSGTEGWVPQYLDLAIRFG